MVGPDDYSTITDKTVIGNLQILNLLARLTDRSVAEEEARFFIARVLSYAVRKGVILAEHAEILQNEIDRLLAARSAL